MVVSRIRHPYGYRADDIEAEGRSYRRHRYNAARGPVAALILDVTDGASPLTVVADLSNSYDINSEGDVTYSLDWGDGLAADTGTIGVSTTETRALTAGVSVAELLVDGQPSDGDTVEIDDGQGNTVIFEFESGGGVSGSNVEVTIGGDADATATNLASAIDGSALQISAAVDGSTANQVNLTHDVAGSAGDNASITAAGANPPTVQAVFAGGQSDFDVELTVTDQSGNTDTDTVRVSVT